MSSITAARFKAVRERLGATQDEIAKELGCSQGNVSLLENGQTLMPDIARRLVALAVARGVNLTMDHLYGLAPLPPAETAAGPPPD